jgi:indole-3-glycerol phosphate synthase
VRSLAAALGRPGRRIIAEIKRRSPSAGVIRETLDAAEIAAGYAQAGAAALSIVTEPDFFGGSDADLAIARSMMDLPVLRKDFIVDRTQVFESKALGADAILLLVRVLDGPLLARMLEAAAQAGLEALVEVHDEHELDRALGAGATLVGVNNRDLRDFSVDLSRAERLAGRIPAGVIGVAESGIHDPEDLQRLEAAGFHAFLVGESLLRAGDPAAKLRELLA